MKHLCIGLVIAMVLVICACKDQQPAPAVDSSQPNILFVLVDALRRDHVGFYGYDRPTSPYLDTLAEEGIIFDHALSHCSQTVPSTAAMLTTSMFPALGKPEFLKSRSGQFAYLFSPDGSFPEHFNRHGYDTFAIFTNPHHHQNSGFQDLFAKKISLVHDQATLKEKKLDPNAHGEEVVGEFERLLAADGLEEPWLAYVHTMDVHNPYEPQKFYDDLPITANGVDRYRNAIPIGDEIPSDNDLEFMKQNYDALIRYTDECIQQIHQAAIQHSDRPVILVFTSDHGDEFMDHGGLGHGRTLERELIWIPMLIHGAGLPPQRVPHLMRHVDLGPTLAELAGIPPIDFGDGSSVAGELEQPPEVWPVEASAASYGPLISRTDDLWHLIRNQRTEDMTLYDLAADPTGMRNVSEQHTSVIDSLLAPLKELHRDRKAAERTGKELAEAMGADAGEGLSDETIEQLRQLGYVE